MIVHLYDCTPIYGTICIGHFFFFGNDKTDEAYEIHEEKGGGEVSFVDLRVAGDFK